jgi:hypothetical protein
MTWLSKLVGLGLYFTAIWHLPDISSLATSEYDKYSYNVLTWNFFASVPVAVL